MQTIKEVLDTLPKNQREQLMAAFEYKFAQVVDLPDGRSIGVHTDTILRFVPDQRAGVWLLVTLRKSNMTDVEKEIVCEMFDRWIISFGDYKLKDGTHSPIYVNMRVLPSWPLLMEKVAKAMLSKVHGSQFLGNRFAGLPMSGVPIAVAMGLIGKIPVLYPRQQLLTSKEGLQIVEGVYNPGDAAIAIDDVLTDGVIKHHQIEILRSVGVDVYSLLVVVDREAGGKELMKGIKVQTHCLFTLKQAVQILKEEAGLDEYQYTRTMRYLD